MPIHLHKGMLIVLLLGLQACTNQARSPVSPSPIRQQPSATSATPTSTAISIRPVDFDGYEIITKGEWKVFTSEIVGIGMAESIEVSPDGAVWFLMGQDHVVRYSDGKWEHFDSDPAGESGYIHRIRLGNDNTLWGDGIIWNGEDQAPRQQTLFHLDQGSWTFYTIPLLDPVYESIYSLAVTADGQVWLSSDRNIYSFDEGNWSVFSDVNGYLVESPLNQLWARGDDVLWRFDGKKWVLDDRFQFTGICKLWGEATCESRWLGFVPDGSMWLVDDWQFIHLLPDNSYQAFPRRSFLGAWTTTDELITRDGELWLVGFYGIIHFNGQEWLQLKMDPLHAGLFPKEPVLSVAEDPNGAIWFGTTSRVYLYSPIRCTIMVQSHSAKDAPCAP